MVDSSQWILDLDLKTKEMVPLKQGNTSKHFINILLNGKKSWKMFF
jgi:hypothetical protein